MVSTTNSSTGTATQTVADSSAIIHHFDAATTTPASSSGFATFILHRLRVTELRAKIVANEIEAATVALSGGLISPEMAILILTETGIEVSS